MNNRNEIKNKLANDLINGKIEDFEEIDKGCQFKIVCDEDEEESAEVAEAWQESFDYLREIGAIGTSVINSDEVFDETKQREIIEDYVDCINEFAERGEDLIFCDDLYVQLSDEEYDGKKEIYIFKKENQSISEEDLIQNIDNLKRIIDDNDAIMWYSPQVMKIHKNYEGKENKVTCPKKTALLFETWMKYDNKYKIGYDDIACSFEKACEDELLVVRLNKECIKRINDKYSLLHIN